MNVPERSLSYFNFPEKVHEAKFSEISLKTYLVPFQDLTMSLPHDLGLIISPKYISCTIMYISLNHYAVALPDNTYMGLCSTDVLLTSYPTSLLRTRYSILGILLPGTENSVIRSSLKVVCVVWCQSFRNGFNYRLLAD